MKNKLQNRLKSPVFWTALAAQVLSILVFTGVLDITASNAINDVIGSVCQVLVVFGIFNDPINKKAFKHVSPGLDWSGHYSYFFYLHFICSLSDTLRLLHLTRPIIEIIAQLPSNNRKPHCCSMIASPASKPEPIALTRRYVMDF
ncbi:MAG TPA: phage holin [Clostridiales bacterium]|nr:phage holin [Clostridiales bacterium]